MSRRNKNEVAYSDLTESGEELEACDGVGLVKEDSDSKLSKARKYAVSPTRFNSRLPSWCRISRLTRNERICLVVGAVALVTIIVVFVIIAVVASPSPKPAGSGAGNNSSTNGTTGGGSSSTNGTTGGGSNSTQGGNGTSQDPPWSDIRLQSTILPELYDIALSLDMDSFQVTGTVSIMCSVTDNVNYIALHTKDMTIAPNGHRVVREGKDIPHNAVLYPENDFFIFNLTEPMEPGMVSVSLEFNYTLREALNGFYRSSYIDADGNKQYLGTTHFEPTDARKAFPCFDEPALKANFTMHMTHQPRYRAWFNMPVTSSTTDNATGLVTTHFMTSRKMSTYLVAFIVSDFECVGNTINSTSGKEIMVQVCSNPVVVESTQYALEVATNVIMFYERQFAVPYPLPKQDLFAIPDFAAGAMENWGLITYRETAVLYNEGVNPATSKQRVAVVIAHELAHQWFGDLVTMAWWDGLWLNEGFASFMEYIGTDSTEPSFNMLEQFVADDLVAALSLDGLNESHPILQHVNHPDEINSLFDAISYSKGASIIRMLNHYIGPDVFRSGITSYLNEHRYGNAETHELWEALQSEVQDTDGYTVSEIMDTWTLQMGYPVFTVDQTTDMLTQTRFFSVQPDDPNSIAPSPFNYTWKAPFNYLHYSSAASEPTITTLPLVTATSTAVQWPEGGWIKANLNQTGFYRVNYDVSNWLEIAAYLKKTDLESSVLTAKDRAGVLDDAFALGYAGLLDSTVAFNLSIYLVHEREYIPWRVAVSWLYKLDGLLSLTPYYGQYLKLISPMFGPIVSSLPTTSTNLSHLDIYLRSLVLQAAVDFGNAEVTENATELVDPDLKSLVYGVGVAQGGEEEWDFVWQQYLQTSNPYEKRLFLRSLGRTKQPWLLNRYLNYSISKLRSQDTLSAIVSVSYNIHGRYLAWNFVRSNWSYFSKTYGADSFFDRFVKYITASFTTDFELQEVRDFFESYQGSASRGARQAVEVIKGNIAWLTTYRNGLFS